MRDRDLEDRIRAVLRVEGDTLPLIITPAELERRLALRRRERTGHRLSLSAASVAAVLVVAIVAFSNGWVLVPRMGSSPVPAPSALASAEPGSPEPSGPAPTSSDVVVSPDGPCAPLDVVSADRTPEVVIDVHPPNGVSVVRSGQLGAYRLAGRDVGNLGSWDHDTIAFEPATTAAWPSGITVLAVAPDTCLTGVAVDAVPFGSVPATTPALAVDLQESEPRRLLGFSPPPEGDWFVRVHAAFQTTDGSEAFSETFFRIASVKETHDPSLPGDCDAADPTQSSTPPTISVGTSPGDAIAYGGQTTASLWDGRETGTTGSWAFPTDPDWIRVDSDLQTLQFVTDPCLVDVTVEALLTQSIDTSPGTEPIGLPVIDGEGSRAVRVTAPPAGSWTVRLRATFATADGSQAWSETLFAMHSTFNAPSLTMGGNGGVAASAQAGCANYTLASGGFLADTCGAPFTVNGAAVRMVAASAQSVDLSLSDGWQIDAARVTAVDARLVASGAFAPEHSVAFIDQGGAQVSTPLTLEPGRWIVRVALNGSRGGDSFDAYYDLSVEVTP